MNAQFHTPSFGDEVVFDLVENETGIGTATDGNGVGISSIPNHFNRPQHQHLDSKRIRNMDMSLDEYHSANDESLVNTTFQTSPTKNAQTTPTATLAARKQMTPTASDANEPAKPLSAYGLFFRDTVSAIKQQNPNCTFPELSRIVSSMWEALDVNHKNVYSKKHDTALAEYLKQMRIYRQQQDEQQQTANTSDANPSATTAPVPTPALQTKPAVFTITRMNADISSSTNSNAVANNNEVSTKVIQPQAQTASATADSSTSVNDPAQPQIQMLSEAGAVQKCMRENCNKRAIINPDWEDEYCSNECVVIHCRNVFNGWVQSNMESRKQ